MGLFDKVQKAAGSIGNSATRVGSSVGTAAQEHSELTKLKMQVNVIEQELQASYVQIGRKYVDYVIETNDMPGIDVSDILKLMDPKLTKKAEIEAQIIELEKQIKNNAVLREKQAAEAEYLAEKSKLDKALGMDVISQQEYDEKLAVARKKVDNFEEIRRVEQQYSMKLITKEEKEAKIKALIE